MSANNNEFEQRRFAERLVTLKRDLGIDSNPETVASAMGRLHRDKVIYDPYAALRAKNADKPDPSTMFTNFGDNPTWWPEFGDKPPEWHSWGNFGDWDQRPPYGQSTRKKEPA